MTRREKDLRRERDALLAAAKLACKRIELRGRLDVEDVPLFIENLLTTLYSAIYYVEPEYKRKHLSRDWLAT